MPSTQSIDVAKPTGPFTLRICAGCGQQLNDGHHAHDGRLAPVYDVPAAPISEDALTRVKEDDETWRAIAARTAAIIEAQCFDIPRLGKSRSAVLHKTVEQLRAAALDDDPERPYFSERWFRDALKRLRKGSD